MKQQQRMVITKNLMRKIRSRGKMDVENRWWVCGLLPADCEKAWIHTGWEDTMQKLYHWLEDMKKEDEKEKMEEMHQKQGANGQEGGRQRWALHNITKPTPWRRGAQILEKEEDDVRLSDRCEANRKEWSMHWNVWKK